MDPLAHLNTSAASLLGWKKSGLSYERDDGRGYVEVLTSIPDFCDNFAAMWLLVEYASSKKVEYSLFMLHYDRHPIYMASFIKGLVQRTSTGECPRVATVKAFIMMFTPEDPPPLTKKGI